MALRPPFPAAVYGSLLSFPPSVRARALLERQIIYMTSQSREPRSRDHPAQPKCKRHIQHPLPYYRQRKARRDQRNHSESQTQRDKLELCSSVKLGNGTNDSGAVTTALALARGKENGTKEPHPTAHFHPTDGSKKLTSASIISPRDPSHNRKTDANRTTPHAQRARVQG